MKESTPPGAFTEEWAEYLRQHGHDVRISDAAAGVVRSSNGKGAYCWLLRCTSSERLLIRTALRKALVRQARLARRRGERCYVVVRFTRPETKALVIPVSRALEARHLRGNRAGISWND